MSHQIGFTTHQLIKFTAEKLALQNDPQAFTALYTVRGLAWGTPGAAAMAQQFDLFMAPYLAQAAALVKPVIEQAGAQAKVDATFQSMVDGIKGDFDAQLTGDDDDNDDHDSYSENLNDEDNDH